MTSELRDNIAILNLENQLALAKTCNDVAAVLFPNAAGQAFLEFENPKLNESPYLELLDLNDDFWALTLENVVFLADEDHFRQFRVNSGLYEAVQESTLIGQLLSKLNRAGQYFPRRLKIESFLNLKNRSRLKSVVERAKDLLAVEQSFFKDRCPNCLNLANGVFDFGNKTFNSFSPDHPITQKLPVKYDPAAKPEMFLGAFLRHILDQDDIDLLQRYSSQFLQGTNYTQKMLILTGDAGWGKSSLMKIFGSILGWERVGIIRDQLYRNEQELGHYQNKHLLYHPDMPSQFLNHDRSGIFKQLVGGDPLWAETKESARLVFEGHFPLVLACNGKPQIRLDQDSEAWLRRLVMLHFKKPAHDQHIGKLAELLEREGPGILNWMLEGRAKLRRDKLQLTMTPEQQNRVNLLVLTSNSPVAFVRTALVKSEGAVLGAVELYEKYVDWCRKHHLVPFSNKEFSQTAKPEIEINFGLKCRHDLKAGDGVVRGWKGLGLAGSETASKKSGEAVGDPHAE